jgi:hypothetical protein
MRIAIPMHSGRIAPVFDTAISLLLVDVETGEVVSRREAMLTETGAMRRTQSLRCRLARTLDGGPGGRHRDIALDGRPGR